MYLKSLFVGVGGAVAVLLLSLLPSDLIAHRGSGAELSPIVVTGLSPIEHAVPAVAEVERAAPEVTSTSKLVEVAVSRLAPHVGVRSHPEALDYAFRAYYNYRNANPKDVRKPYLYFVDFGLDSSTARGYVFDMDALTVVAGPFHVAHGRGSAPNGGSTPTRFLNRSGSKATSLGLYLAQETYNFNGRSGGRPYKSIGLRLKGVSGRFNSAARSRGIVVHGAPYVTSTRAGRSEGCPAMSQELAKDLIPMIANGGMVFHFSPLDQSWLREDPWASAARS